MYHEKMGIISDLCGNKVAFSGSMNESATAMMINYEAIDVFCSWNGDMERVLSKENAFESIWNDVEPNIKTIYFPKINILYKFTGYDTDGKITNIIEYEAPREYDNNKLVKEWEHWGGYNTYEYIGDKIIKKTDYTKNGEELHITTYKYSGNLLIEEKRETSVGSLMYLKTYKYDSQNRLVQIKDGKNIIEKNYYFNKKLIEKRTYYFGIDPGYDICYGNYIIRYKY